MYHLHIAISIAHYLYAIVSLFTYSLHTIFVLFTLHLNTTATSHKDHIQLFMSQPHHLHSIYILLLFNLHLWLHIINVFFTYHLHFIDILLIFFSNTLSMTGSIYSSTSRKRNGKPYLMASSSCFRKSESLNVHIYKSVRQRHLIQRQHI